MASYEKLVRDKIPQVLDSKNIPYEKRIATPEEFRSELIKKLKEETEEFMVEGSPEELADVLEVVEALLRLDEYQGVGELKIKKREERGGFNERIILKGEK